MKLGPDVLQLDLQASPTETRTHNPAIANYLLQMCELNICIASAGKYELGLTKDLAPRLTQYQ